MTEQHPIPMNEVTDDFVKCWQSAGRHIQSQVEDGSLNFFRANLTPPFLEHLSFRIGNQIFFVHITDDVGELKKPSTLEATIRASEIANGIPCVMEMQQTKNGWTPVHSDWGLTHAITGETLSPLDLVTDELIEMSDWELRDFAIQVVRGHLENEGHLIQSTGSDPGIDPQIWFVSKDDLFQYVIVRAARYPAKEASLPSNLDGIIEYCKQQSDSGFFASVTVANANDAFDPDAEKVGGLPLWRGQGLLVKFDGLIPLEKNLIQ